MTAHKPLIQLTTNWSAPWPTR